MQFVVIGLDGTDEGAPARRRAVRQDHIAMGDKLLKSGNLCCGDVWCDITIHKSNTRDPWQFNRSK